MKTIGCLLLLLLMLPAEASNSGSLLLRGHVPSRSKVVLDPARGSYTVINNSGKFALHTAVMDFVDNRGYRIVIVTPQ